MTRLTLRCTPSSAVRQRISGFSLVELAIVLMIVGILMSGVIMAVSDTMVGTRRSATLAQLRQIEDALYGFAQSQGRLPCPATAISNGYEDGAPGACSQSDGFVPNATLGLYGQVDGNGVLVDAWQNPVRYAVVSTGSPNFTDAASLRSFFGIGAAVPNVVPMLRICSDATGGSCAGAGLITGSAPAVAYSMGANWSTYTSANEAENVDGDAIFVSTAYSEAQFDDQLVWLSPYVLFNRMISAGKLP